MIHEFCELMWMKLLCIILTNTCTRTYPLHRLASPLRVRKLHFSLLGNFHLITNWTSYYLITQVSQGPGPLISNGPLLNITWGLIVPSKLVNLHSVTIKTLQNLRWTFQNSNSRGPVPLTKISDKSTVTMTCLIISVMSHECYGI